MIRAPTPPAPSRERLQVPADGAEPDAADPAAVAVEIVEPAPAVLRQLVDEAGDAIAPACDEPLP